MALTADYKAKAARAAGVEPFFYVKLAGAGVRSDAIGRSAAKFSTWIPPSTWTGYQDFKEGIADDAGTMALTYSMDTLRPSDGSTDAGSLDVTIIDPDEFLSGYLAYMRAAISVAGSYPTILNEDINRTAVDFDVVDDAAISDGDMLFLDNEACRANAAPAANNVTVDRAQWGTTAANHYTGDQVRAAMIQPKGQIVELYRGFKDLTATDEGLRWRGVLSGAQQTADGLGWSIQAMSALTLLDVDVMRRQGRFRVLDSVTDFGNFTLHVATDDSFDQFADTTADIWIGGSFSKGALHVTKGTTKNPSYITTLVSDTAHQVEYLSSLDSWREDDGEGAGGRNDTIYEVAPVDQTLDDVRFPSHHAFIIALTWILSTTGDSSNSPDANSVVTTAYDVLPEGWGAEVPAEFVDAQSFIDLAARIPADVPNLVYGIGGKSGFALRSHLEEELLGPYGVHIVQIDGVLTLVQYAASPAWLADSSVEIGHDEILEDTIPANSVELSDAVQSCFANTGYSWVHEKFLAPVTAHQRRRESWSLRGGRVIDFKLRGYKPGGAHAVVKQLVTGYLHRHRWAPPRLVVDLPDTHEHQINAGDTIRVTSSHLINLSDGTRGVTDYVYICANTQWADHRFKVLLLNQNGAIRVASIAPAILITTKIGNRDFDCGAVGPPSAADFTDAGYFDGYDGDIDWFTAGILGVGDMINAIDGDSLEEVAGPTFITSITDVAGNWRIHTDGGLGAAATKDYLVWATYDDANVTDGQKDFAFFSSGGQLSASTDPPYIYSA